MMDNFFPFEYEKEEKLEPELLPLYVELYEPLPLLPREEPAEPSLITIIQL
jgi:hypothetical protein